MLKALVIKELRESAGILAVALLAALWLLATLTGVQLLPLLFSTYGTGTANFPFVADGLAFSFAVVIGSLAVALGLKQTAWEAGHGTYYYLLHRPASRRLIFGTKLVVGAGLVLGLGGLLLALYALWAATPGNSPTPFAWSMTVPAWQLSMCMSLVYLGAFLSGIRPARWFGTRLAPLVAGAMCAFAVYLMSWFWLAVVAVSISAAVMCVAIFYYARQRDY